MKNRYRIRLTWRVAIFFPLIWGGMASGQMADPNVSTISKQKCPVCGMFVAMFPDWNARIEFADSTYATFDGAKDMFKYYADVKKYNPSKSRKDITAISVMDYYAKTSIDGQKAFYVIWGDVYGPMGHEPIPFAREGDAKKYMKAHKGKKILRFKEVTPKVILDLDNP